VAGPSLARQRASAVAAGVAAAALVLLAAVGVVSVAGRSGFFHQEDWQVLLTLVAGFLCGACATAALRLLERRPVDPLGWLAVVVAGESSVVLALGIWWRAGWREHGELLGKLVTTSLVLLITTLVLAILRLIRRPGSRFAFATFGVTVLCAIGVDALAVAKIWSVSRSDTASATGSAGARVMLALGIVGVLTFLLTPLADRLEPLLPRTRRL
jgi:hypothetical protein